VITLISSIAFQTSPCRLCKHWEQNGASSPHLGNSLRKFREISRGQERIVALHSRGGYLLRVWGGLEGPEHLAQRCLTRYFERSTSVMGSRHIGGICVDLTRMLFLAGIGLSGNYPRPRRPLREDRSVGCSHLPQARFRIVSGLPTNQK
jgi:hypothetical protein